MWSGKPHRLERLGVGGCTLVPETEAGKEVAPVAPGPSVLFEASRQALVTVGMWVCGAAVSWHSLRQRFPARRPFTAEIYRRKATRLHKRS